MTGAEICAEAARITTQDRAATHGRPEDIFELIARVWGARLGIDLSAAQVCILLSDLKTCRP